ncbi:ribokinase [Paraburkholderia phymatum]|uniref:Ribokinase n=1 Tax=Paraburkholderia phymatum TaxID=148447 RepID=A0ACC6U480_9BURK
MSIGSINLDLQMRSDEPPGAETIRAYAFSQLSGGKGANRAYLARVLGHEATLIGMVGSDHFGKEVLAPLSGIGVDVAGVGVAQGVATAVSIIVVPPDGKKHIVFAPNANEVWDQDAIELAVRALTSVPRTALVAMDCEIGPDACSALLDAAVERGMRIVLDAAPPARALDEAVRRFWPMVYAFTPNEEEATALTGIGIDTESDAVRAARCLHDNGIALACVKRRDGGCIAVSDEGAISVLAGKVDVVDSTGAGDAFTGALAVTLAEQRPLDDALRFATAAANLAVTRWGSQQAYGRRDEIDSWSAKLTVERIDG